MFTQAMPSLVDALRPAVQPGAIGPITQALGNCAQPLTHRAGVNFVAPTRRNDNGAYGGGPYGNGPYAAPRGSAWNPALYQNLFPGGQLSNSANFHTDVDIGGMNISWPAGNRYDSQFYFPTNQFFNQNQFYGGPTVNVSGGGNIDYISNQYFQGETVETENITTQTLNGDPTAGPMGPPGAPGRDGQRGAPGAPIAPFGALPPGFFREIRYLTGILPRVRFIPERVSRAHRYVKDAWVRKEHLIDVPTNSIKGGTVTFTPQTTGITVPTNAISGGTVSLSPSPVSITVPTSISFDPDTCSISIDATTSFYAFPSAPSSMSVNGQAASTQVRTVASSASFTAAITGLAANTVTVYAATVAASTRASVPAANGFVLKGNDADFWEREAATVVVAREPSLVGVIPAAARVYQQ